MCYQCIISNCPFIACPNLGSYSVVMEPFWYLICCNCLNIIGEICNMNKKQISTLVMLMTLFDLQMIFVNDQWERVVLPNLRYKMLHILIPHLLQLAEYNWSYGEKCYPYSPILSPELTRYWMCINSSFNISHTLQ